MLSVLLVLWKALPAFADEMADLRAQLTAAQGEQRLKILENIYYLSQETSDLDYQYRCICDLIAEAKRQNDRVAEVNALAERAWFFYNNDMNDSVFVVVRRDMERMKQLEEWPTYYEMWGCVANTYLFSGKNNIAINEADSMFADARNHSDILGMGQANCIMGIAYSNLRSFDQSIEMFERSLEELSEITPPPSVFPTVYVYYGDALAEMKDYARLSELTKRWHDMLTDFIKQHKLENNPTADIYWAYYYLACAQAEIGQSHPDTAQKNLDDAKAHIYSMDNELGGKWLYLSAQLCLMRGNYTEALDYNTRRIQQVEELEDLSTLVIVRQQRAEILEHMGRYMEALLTYKDAFLLNDSLNADKTRSQLNETNSIFQVQEKEMENERLQMAKERDQFRFIIIIATVVLLSLAVFMFFRIRSARKLKQAHEELQGAYGDLQKANADLHQANLVIAETTAAKERIEYDLRKAAEIQISMLPPEFPQDDKLDIYASMTPAKEVGGDLYNFLLIDGKLYFALGDVSGKGMPASLFMAQATRLFHTLAKQQMKPSEIAMRLTEELGENNPSGMFVTMFLGYIDLQTAHLCFCNAGHNPPVIGNDHFLDMEPNPPIGLFPDMVQYVDEEIENVRNIPIFIYTDGLNEAENNEKDQFGDDHLLQVMHDHPFVSSQQTVELLKSEVERHREGAEPNDDLTMLCIMIKGE